MKISVGSFNGGEVTPLLLGRPDLESLRRACLKMRNFIPRVFGGAFRRPSLMHKSWCATPGSHARLIPFNFSVTTGYQIELGNFTMRFWNVQTGELDGGALETPWSAGEIDEVHYAGVNDLMIFTHPNHQPHELLRKPEGWEFREVAWKYPALRDEDLRSDDNLDPVAVDAFRVPAALWPETGFHGTPGNTYTFSVGWSGGAGTKTATLQRWSGSAWVSLRTFTWTATTYSGSWVYETPSTGSLQNVRIIFSGPVATTSGFARYSSNANGFPTPVNHLINLNLAQSQPRSRQPVTINAGQEWRVEVNGASAFAVPSGATLTVQRLSGSTWVNLATVPLIAGQVTVYRGPLLTVNRTYRLSWAGRAFDGATMAIQTVTYPSAPDITLALNATSGNGRTMTASSALFNERHVGSWWRVRHRRTLASVQRVGAVGAFSGTSGELLVSGQWDFFTYGRWSGTLSIQQRLPDGSWETLRSWVGNKDRNITASGNVDGGTVMRINIESGNGEEASDAAVPRFVLESADPSHSALVVVTGYTSPTVVTVDIKRAAFSTAATRYWNEGAWSAYRGYPRTVAIHQQRLLFAGTEKQPQVLWGSVIGDLRNFENGVLDDMGFTYQIAAQESNPILWMVSQNGLVIGTQGEEWIASAENAAITPSNIQIDRQSRNGSEPVQPVLAESAILYVQRGGLNVREYVFAFEKQVYVSPILTQLAEHLTRSGIRSLCQTTNPEQSLWAVTNDGKLLVCSYRREEEVVAWSVMETDGEIEWASAGYGGRADELWLVVKRDDTRRIERLDVDHWQRIETGHSWALDAAVRVTGEALEAVTGLEHLEGRVVSALADGAVIPPMLVVDGAVTLPRAAREVIVGLPMVAKLQPWPIFLALDDGTSQGRKKRVVSLMARFHRSGAASYRSFESGKLYEVGFRRPPEAQDAPSPLFDGYLELPMEGSYREETSYSIETDSPLPLNVLSLIPSFGVYGE
jgi:hypothetical protein